MPDDLPYSKGRINRAGRALRRALLSGVMPLANDEFAEEIEVVDAFRATHRTPLLTARMGLRSCIDSEKLRAVELTQRLKRTPTIVDKLRREQGMNLARMQDIGGCRAVFVVQEEVTRVQTRFVRNSLRRNGTEDRVQDYVEKPQPSGYRALHLWTRYGGCRIEVQLRTIFQHEWAKLVEELVVLTGIDYKSGDGSEIVHRWLRKLSELSAFLEAGQDVDEKLHHEYAALHEAARAQIARDIEQGDRIDG